MSDAQQSAGEEQVQLPGAGSDNGDGRATVLDSLRQKHVRVKEDKHLDVDIPGYDGELFARFRPYEVSESEKKAKKLAEQQRRHQPIVLASSCDTIIDACDEMYVRTADGRELPVDEEVPVKFEKRLAELLGFKNADKLTEARQVVIELFPTQQAVLAVSAEITEWLTGARDEADEEFLGNSKGTMR